ncbi:MAG TPA: hypothetical protein VHD87_00035 [Acidimicrobiales bacterium]|nr:hypothetical protein [Acidimicrobiales bacterium]
MKRRLLVLAVALAVVGTFIVVQPHKQPRSFTSVAARVRKRTTTTIRRTTTTTIKATTTTAKPAPTTTTTTKPATTTTTRPSTGACTVFPADNPWNTDISNYPVDPNSANYIASIGASTNLHPDFGTSWDGAPIGIPDVHVGAGQPLVPVSFDYADESDAGPYPIPPNAPVEGGDASTGDRHVIVVDDAHCALYEMWDAHKKADSSWHAGSGAKFDLRSNALRPDYWTSADAAGLPIYAGLVRYDEVRAGAINHALRFTVAHTQRGFIHPATHYASSSTDANLPPMGLRLRMKASYSCAAYSADVQVICSALKRYGMIVADNGSNWYVSGEHDDRWNDDALGDLKRIPGSAFQAVSTGSIVH